MPPERSKATASARGFCVRTSDSSIEAKPCSAFVTSTLGGRDVGRQREEGAKGERHPVQQHQGALIGRAASANELTLQDLLGDVTHARATAHRRLLDDLEGRRLVESALLHQHLLGPLDDLARLDLVLDV